MEKLFLLFLLFHVSSPVKHSLKYLLTGSSGIPNFPEFMTTVELDNTVAGYCDNMKKKLEPRQDWVKKMFENDPEHLQWCKYMCFKRQPNVLKYMINSLMHLSNQTGGVHILQRIYGCEWDDETGEVNCYINSGYDGEDVLSFNLETKTWIALKPEAKTIEQIWNADRDGIDDDEKKLIKTFPEFLKKYVAFANGSQLIKELPSVSLLQQTPSSPVRCFASGFYPERASLFWRKDGEELHEDVEHGEILPNTDGTFQKSVDLKVSLDKPEDWRRYECVFQPSGVKNDIVTKLDKTAIKTNYETPSNMAAIIGVVVGVLVLVVVVAGVYLLKKKRSAKRLPSSGGSDTGSERSDEASKPLNSKPQA